MAMVRRLVCRLCAALIAVALAATLQVQTAQGAIPAAHMVVTAGADLAMPEGCDGRLDGLPPEVGCPAAFCLAVAIVSDKPALALSAPATVTRLEHAYRLGLSPTPDPFPPRPSLLG
jgi:hypothetical protein